MKQQAKHFRILVAYLGTNFCGFQVQDRVRTVEGELKQAFLSLFGQEVVFSAGGRTDAGVHARGQVVSVSLNTELSTRQLTLALRSKLPSDMSVWRVDRMPKAFDARRQSIGKRYVYRIYQGLVADPFSRDYCYFVRRPLDVDAMNEAASTFVGEHDFSSFRGSGCTAAHARRYIWHARASRENNIIDIDIRGNAFCMNMVRIMVGTLVEVGKGKLGTADIEKALNLHQRNLAGPTAPALGLTLEQIYYPDDLSDAGIPSSARFPRFPVTSISWQIDNSLIEYGPA